MDVKVRLNDVNISLFERVSNITGTETGIDKDGWIDVDTILSALDELTDKYDDLGDKLNDFKQDVNDNFKRKSLKESYE